jgi:predicted anti-sigma-YlaC factor YlaD
VVDEIEDPRVESSARGLRARGIALVQLAIHLARLIVVAGVGEEVGEEVQRRTGRRGVARKLAGDTGAARVASPVPVVRNIRAR